MECRARGKEELRDYHHPERSSSDPVAEPSGLPRGHPGAWTPLLAAQGFSSWWQQLVTVATWESLGGSQELGAPWDRGTALVGALLLFLDDWERLQPYEGKTDQTRQNISVLKYLALVSWPLSPIPIPLSPWYKSKGRWAPKKSPWKKSDGLASYTHRREILKSLQFPGKVPPRSGDVCIPEP